jgi:hypothetical protein
VKGLKEWIGGAVPIAVLIDPSVGRHCGGDIVVCCVFAMLATAGVAVDAQPFLWAARLTDWFLR